MYKIKQLTAFSGFILASFMAVAQDTASITFTAQITDGSYIALDSVKVTNVTQNWSQTLYYPDTVLQMVKSNVSVENLENQYFIISQNIPNPFDGTTNVELQLADNEDVELFLYDLNGKLCASSKQKMEHGTYKIAISVAVAQPYLLSIKTSKGSQTIKMLSTQGQGDFSIKTMKISDLQEENISKVLIEQKWNINDNFVCVAYCTYNGTQKIMQQNHTLQNVTETILFTIPIGYSVGDKHYDSFGNIDGVVWWIADTLFYIDTIPYGQHGKQVSLLETKLTWGTGATSYRPKFEIYALDSFDGVANTNFIMHWRDTISLLDDEDTSRYNLVQAAPWCVSLGEGWYLPAIRELWEMLNVADSVLNPTLETIPDAIKFEFYMMGFYWSSTAVCCPYNGEARGVFFSMPHYFEIDVAPQQAQPWFTRAAKWF
ncbi:MAG: T9SS type A sorting domain-containing protein [Bacteroidales bacterium]|jgi:hypothetical protein|nr:T9SS type A sorting domain-containing protein [Bacteroidales bacterium]